jgi:hypothetical protein
MDWLLKLPPQEQKEWQDMIIHFAFEQDEWGEARSSLFALLQKDNKQADEPAIRSYLSCCAESAGNVQPLPPLSSLVQDLYQAYGMESAQEK